MLGGTLAPGRGARPRPPPPPASSISPAFCMSSAPALVSALHSDPIPAPDGTARAAASPFGERRYNAWNDHVKRRWGGRVQKVSVAAGFTCPNRDAPWAAEADLLQQRRLHPRLSRSPRPDRRADRRRPAFSRPALSGTARFIAYFQTYSNTYGEFAHLRARLRGRARHGRVAGLAIGTRPDCLPDAVLDYRPSSPASTSWSSRSAWSPATTRCAGDQPRPRLRLQRAGHPARRRARPGGDRPPDPRPAGPDARRHARSRAATICVADRCAQAASAAAGAWHGDGARLGT